MHFKGRKTSSRAIGRLSSTPSSLQMTFRLRHPGGSICRAENERPGPSLRRARRLRRPQPQRIVWFRCLLASGEETTAAPVVVSDGDVRAEDEGRHSDRSDRRNFRHPGASIDVILT